MTIEGMTVLQNTIGIFAQSEQDAPVSNVTIRRSRIQEHVFAGIQLQDLLGDNLIANNEIVRNGRDGITIDSRNAVDGLVHVMGNTVRESGDEGVEFLSTVGVLTGNIITENTSDGVVISNDSIVNENDFSNNQLTNNDANGILVDRNSVVTLMNSTFDNNGRSGIRAVRPGTSVTAINNDIKSNVGEGVRLDRDARGIFIQNNIEANMGAGGARSRGDVNRKYDHQLDARRGYRHRFEHDWRWHLDGDIDGQYHCCK